MSAPATESLSTGGELRRTNRGAGHVAVLLNGGTAKPVAGTWSSTSELLVTRLAARHPTWELVEVRYRVKSWRELDSCVADGGAALDAVSTPTTRPVLLIGFSMGGAVSIAVAGHPNVRAVLGLAPWIPDELELGGLRGKRLDVLQGSLDRWLPGIPGVSPSVSRRGFERAGPIVTGGEYTIVRGGLHGAAVRRPSGRLQPLPRAGAWVEHVSAELRRNEQRWADTAST